MTDVADIQRGRDLALYFHNESIGKPGYAPKNIDELAKTINPKRPDLFFDGLGFQAKTLMWNGTYDLEDCNEAMEKLARVSNGKIPTANSFSNALSKVAQGGPSFLDSVSYTAQTSAADVLKGSQVVGQAIIDTGASLSKIAPLLVTVGVIAYVYLFVKKRS